MRVKVIEIKPFWTTIEFEEDGFLQRRQLPTALCDIKKRGPIDLPSRFIEMGTLYGEVDLVALLGEELPVIRVVELQDRLRRLGLWTRQDYEKNPQVVRSVLQRLLGASVASIVKAARRS